MLFPNDIQAALLFDRPVNAIEGIVRDFMRVEEARTGATFNVPEGKPGIFYRLFGGDELSVTLEYVDRPANIELFQKTLASAVTGIVCPDIRERVVKSRSHILLNVSHGVLGSSEQVDRLMELIGRPKEGHSLPQFARRLDVCALIGRIACDHAPVQAVHWTQSNQLIPGEKFEDIAALKAPGPLHVHPYLFGSASGPDGKARVGIRSFGARHFIGRELLIEPSELPWAANYETMLAFLRVATIDKGYVIPDGDTFGPEDRSLSYRVIHREAEADDVPLFELQPLMYREFGFVAPDYVPPERVFDDRMPPADLMPPDQEAKMALANEWREKRALAEGIGGRFEVRARDGDGAPPPPVRPLPGFGNRPVFGRKKA
ncbi:MAG TPA: hypothetical protein VHM92_12890 [Allosphingosinicella sp.]|nr:hypothetical protein [Allosphingosinicella sp.]